LSFVLIFTIMVQRFTKHPSSIGETYLQHLGKALAYSLKFLSLSICCLTHGVFPFMFEHTASNEIERLNKKLQARRGSVVDEK